MHGTDSLRPRFRSARAALVLALCGTTLAFATGKDVDLDGQSGNGDESRCELTVISTFPAEIENVITNRAVDDAFDFNWLSAGPGGFVSSATSGTSTGVGAKWTWSTNQSIVSFTGSTCEDDICFLQTAGPDPADSTCSRGCLDDGVTLTVDKGLAGEALLDWTGGDPDYTVWRSDSASTVAAEGNDLITTPLTTYTDAASLSGSNFYLVRAATCITPKACTSNADCNEPSEGTCVSRGPFQCPGRTLSENAGEITVSSASLTSSLVTFFSPPKEVFRIRNEAFPGAIQETFVNLQPEDQTIQSPEFPLGCCEEDPLVPNQLRCGAECVDYLNDPDNCGACGNACGDDECCTNGNCVSLCPEGQVLCEGVCVDLLNDSDNCGACGNACIGDNCCSAGVCVGFCEDPDDTYCGDGLCADLQNDDENCGECGNVCPEGTCCFEGSCASVCLPDEDYCPDGLCADLQNDSDNCGACGNVCTGDTCCFGGVCAGFCDPGLQYCAADGTCADLQNDSQNCGACGNVCAGDSCCSGGVCADFCDPGLEYCAADGTCADFQNDSENCGACGNVCPEGSCCSNGTCSDEICETGRTQCSDGLCYDLDNDPNNCGACGNSCGESAFCDAGVCVDCGNQGGRNTQCDNRCVNLNTDPYNCGACGNSCQEQCPSDFTGVCSNGLSCRCDAGTPPPPPPPNTPVPTEPFCPNPNPTSALPGGCPNPSPTSAVPGGCPNPNPTGPSPETCPNESPSGGPVPGGCPNPNPTGATPPSCPNPGPPAPIVTEAPICLAPEVDETLAPGESLTLCRSAGLLFTELATVADACGSQIPGPDGSCGGGVTNKATGTFMRLIPADDSVVGDAYATPQGVDVLSDDSGDYMIAPGETATIVVDVVNVGPVDMVGAVGTVIAEPVDLTQDGVNNPTAIDFSVASSDFGTIAGTQPSVDCEPIVLQPASNQVAFELNVPPDFPPDTAYPFVIRFDALVDGQPFTTDMKLAIGITDLCDVNEGDDNFDDVDGFNNPLTDLVPKGNPVPFPNKALNAGKTIPLKMRLACGGVDLRGADITPPEVVGISEETLGPLDLSTLDLDADNDPDDLFFRFNESNQRWILNLRSDDLGTGIFTIEVRVGGKKSYFSGFELR